MRLMRSGVAGATLSSLLGNDDERKECLIRYLLDLSSGGFATENPLADSTEQYQGSVLTQPPRAPAKASPALRDAEGVLSVGPTPSKFRRTDDAENGPVSLRICHLR